MMQIKRSSVRRADLSNKPADVVVSSTFSSLLFINECLLDEERTRALQAAIHRQVTPGDVVLDAGTGSGILALIAAAAGARKVYAVDVDRDALALARQSVQASPFA